ncbi:hypothetical protein KSS87_016196 [Heliosperma pusillum]|nr:hypothetical protein KSS87_016196 [Heliosperma pusillum]
MSLKFSPTTLPLPPQNPQTTSPSLAIDSLLHHLLHLSSTSKTAHFPKLSNSSHISKNTLLPSLPISVFNGHSSNSVNSFEGSKVISKGVTVDDASLDFLSDKCKHVLNAMLDIPLCSLNAYFESVKLELAELDFVSLVKGLDVLGNWEKAVLLFEWSFLNFRTRNEMLDHHAVELVARILSRESQHTVAAKLFDVVPIEEYCLDVRTYTCIIYAYARVSKFDRAIVVFESMKEKGVSPNLVTYNVMLDVYGKMGRSWDRVVGLLDEMSSEGLEFDEFTCSTVIAACGREGLLDEASKFFAEVKAKGYVPGTVTYNSLLQVFGKAGVYSEALSILKEMEEKGCPADSVTYNELVATYVRAGFLEEGANVIDTMTRKGILPNTITYTTIIDAYGKAGKVDKAMTLFNRMKESGCVPNVCTYNAILAMLGKKSRSEEMVEILCEMKLTGCPPDRVTWNTMLAMSGSIGMEKYVNRVFQEMKRSGFEPDRDTFNSLISAYGRCGSRIDATKIFEEMMEAGFSPCVTTYNACLNVLSRKGDCRAAESLIQEMQSKGFKPNDTSYSLMIQCYAKAGNVRGIQTIEQEIYHGHIFPNWMLLRTLVLANFRCRSLLGMERAFKELQRSGYKLDLVVYNSMLSIYARNKMYDRAHGIQTLIQENGIQPDLVTYNTLMDMYARSGECWKAEEILTGLLKKGFKPDLVSYNTVIKAFCREGLMQEAIKIMSEMTARGIRPCIVTYNTFLAGYAGRGMFSEAYEVINYMVQHKCRPNELSYKIVVDSYCKANKYKEAMDFVAKIKQIDYSFDDQSLLRLSSRITFDVELSYSRNSSLSGKHSNFLRGQFVNSNLFRFDHVIGRNIQHGVTCVLPLTEENVEKVLDEVRPGLLADGGNVALHEIDGLVVVLKLQGACGSCPSSAMTLKNGIELRLRDKIPEIMEVEQILDTETGLELNEENVEKVLAEIRPYLTGAGGGLLELDQINDYVIRVRLSGPAAKVMTVRVALSQKLREKIPTIATVLLIE